MKHRKRYLATLLAVLTIAAMTLSAAAADSGDLAAQIADKKDPYVNVTVYSGNDMVMLFSSTYDELKVLLASSTDAITHVAPDTASAVSRSVTSYRNPPGITAYPIAGSFALTFTNAPKPNGFLALTTTWTIPNVSGEVLSNWASMTSAEQLDVLESLGLGIVQELETGVSRLIVGPVSANPDFTWAQLIEARAVVVSADSSFTISLNTATCDDTGSPKIVGEFVLLPDGATGGTFYDPLWCVRNVTRGASDNGEWITVDQGGSSDDKANPGMGR